MGIDMGLVMIVSGRTEVYYRDYCTPLAKVEHSLNRRQMRRYLGGGKRALATVEGQGEAKLFLPLPSLFYALFLSLSWSSSSSSTLGARRCLDWSPRYSLVRDAAAHPRA